MMKLDQFLKFKGIALTGGQAKHLIQAGEVVVNNNLETRRGRKLIIGDIVTIGELSLTVEPESSDSQSG